MSKQVSSWTPFFSIHDIFEIYPNIDPKTRSIIGSDGSLGTKLPDGGIRLRFLGSVPSWYAKRELIYSQEFGPLSSKRENPFENLLQDKDNLFGGLYMYADDFYEPYRGAGYLGIGTSGKMSIKNGADPFGCGTISRIWKHTLKVLGRHSGCGVQLTGGWKRHFELRHQSYGDLLARDVRFAFFVDYEHTQDELLEYEKAYQEHRLGKYGSKFPINELPASRLSEFKRHPI